MKKFVVAAAQFESVRGNIEANVRGHVNFVRAAADHHADLIIFPELSITGYEPDLAAGLTLTLDDERTAPLRELTQQSGITIVAGAPAPHPANKPYIGALVFGPNQSTIYRKQHLHPGEEEFFSAGDKGCVIDIAGVKVGLAICADIIQASHARQAAENGVTVYAAGVFIGENGYNSDTTLLRKYASKHKMAVLMSNFCGPSGGIISAGRSAFWNERGRLVIAAKTTEKCLVICERSRSKWDCRTVDLE